MAHHSTLPNAILAVLDSRKRVKPHCGSPPYMSISASKGLHLPHMRANPFSVRPIEAEDAPLLVGRKTLMSNLGHHLRFGSPRMMVLIGERGSGRTSVLHALGNFAPVVHHLSVFPEENPAQTLLNELYCLVAGYDVPGVTSTIVEQMVAALEGRSGDLPLISFDFSGTSGADLAQIFERLAPVLVRLRALVVVALTPAQHAAWSEDLQSAFDSTEPLADFGGDEVRALIDARMRKVSNEGWAASRALIEEALAATGGRPRAIVRHLRDIVDSARGISTPLSRRNDALESMDLEPIEPNDARSRMAPEVAELKPLDIEEDEEEDVFIEEEVEEEVEEVISKEVEESVPDFEFNWEMPGFKQAPPMPELEVEEVEPPDMDRALGGTVLRMQPGTEPPPPPPPPAPLNPFGGLAARQRTAKQEIGLDDALNPAPAKGPIEAKPDPTVSTPVIEPEIESEETTYWVEEEIVEPEPEPAPVMNPILARSIGDDLRSRTPTPPPTPILTPPLDLGRISNLNDGEIAIVEAATAREISPSDPALQAYLAVGRPRLSQIFNSLQKAGVLTVRKKGRTRLFRLSDAANAHLTGGHMEG